MESNPPPTELSKDKTEDAHELGEAATDDMTKSPTATTHLSNKDLNKILH